MFLPYMEGADMSHAASIYVWVVFLIIAFCLFSPLVVMVFSGKYNNKKLVGPSLALLTLLLFLLYFFFSFI